MTKRPLLSLNLKWVWRIGQIAQGVVMGALLFHAVLNLIAVAGHITAFRYEGY